MFFETRLSRYFNKLLGDLNEKVFTVQSTFSLVLFFLFAGFLLGNLFGTFLDTLRPYFLWNGFLGVFILLCVEAVNSLVYGTLFSVVLRAPLTFFASSLRCIVDANLLDAIHPRDVQHQESMWNRLENTYEKKEVSVEFIPKIFGRKKKEERYHQRLFLVKRTLNSFKIGLLFGFFVDSFKVGS